MIKFTRLMNVTCQWNKILALGAHPDDVELGCGGFLQKFGGHVICVTRSYNYKNIEREFQKGTKMLGVTSELWDLPHRELSDSRQKLLEALLRCKESYDTVLIPRPGDVHQDHKVLTEEAQRAFKFKTLLYYELPWNQMTPWYNNLYCVLTREQMDIKISAIEVYTQDRRYLKSWNIEALARVRGTQCSMELAEAFEIARMRV